MNFLSDLLDDIEENTAPEYSKEDLEKMVYLEYTVDEIAERFKWSKAKAKVQIRQVKGALDKEKVLKKTREEIKVTRMRIATKALEAVEKALTTIVTMPGMIEQAPGKVLKSALTALDRTEHTGSSRDKEVKDGSTNNNTYIITSEAVDKALEARNRVYDITPKRIEK